jgi:hypothetical protein
VVVAKERFLSLTRPERLSIQIRQISQTDHLHLCLNQSLSPQPRRRFHRHLPSVTAGMIKTDAIIFLLPSVHRQRGLTRKIETKTNREPS